jgi:hypothetical protein
MRWSKRRTKIQMLLCNRRTCTSLPLFPRLRTGQSQKRRPCWPSDPPPPATFVWDHRKPCTFPGSDAPNSLATAGLGRRGASTSQRTGVYWVSDDNRNLPTNTKHTRQSSYTPVDSCLAVVVWRMDCHRPCGHHLLSPAVQ